VSSLGPHELSPGTIIDVSPSIVNGPGGPSAGRAIDIEMSVLPPTMMQDWMSWNGTLRVRVSLLANSSASMDPEQSTDICI